MNTFLKTVQNNKNFLIVSIIFSLSVLLVAPWGNYSIGDDFYHLIQIQLFQTGDFYRNGQIGPTLVLQAFLGLIWSSIFGLNFVSLKILTILLTFGTIFLLCKIFNLLKVSNILTIIAVLLIIFNPKFYYLSLTFNTEPYFTFLILLSFYYLLLFNKSQKYRFLLLASFFGGLSVLVRQAGVLLFVPIVFSLYLNKDQLNFLKNRFKIFSVLFVFIVLSLSGIFWPRYYTEYRGSSESALSVINFEDLTNKFFNLWKEIPYFSLLIIPFVTFFYKNIRPRFRNYSYISGVVLGIFIFQNNIFDIGNIFYLEGFGARSYTSLRVNLLNNIYFKALISIVLGLVFSGFAFYFFSNLKKFLAGKINKILLITSVLFLVSTILPEVLYERYYLYFEIFFLIFVVSNIETLQVTIFTKVTTLILVLLTIIYAIDFFYDIDIKWKMSYELASERNMNKEKVFVQDNFLKLNYILRKEDIKGVGPLKPKFPEYSCFVVNDVDGSENLFYKFLSLSSIYIEKINILGVNKPSGYGFFQGQVKKCSDCKIQKKEYYFSPLYEVLGVSKYVKAYCLDIKN